MAPGIAATSVRDAITAVATMIVSHSDELTALDSAIGDGDHGFNMTRGVEAVLKDVDTIAAMPVPDALKAIGTRLVMSIGGASGPLYGTLFLALGKALASAPDDAGAALLNAVDAVAARGKSAPGQKTMLDVLYPVAHAIRTRGVSAEVIAVADAAADATRPMLATRGRASFLGERSVGHVDPGARSAALMVRALVESLP